MSLILAKYQSFNALQVASQVTDEKYWSASQSSDGHRTRTSLIGGGNVILKTINMPLSGAPLFPPGLGLEVRFMAEYSLASLNFYL